MDNRVLIGYFNFNVILSLTVKNMENRRCKTVWQSNPSGQNGFALPVWISFRFNVHSLTDNKREPNRPQEFPQYGKKGVGFF